MVKDTMAPNVRREAASAGGILRFATAGSVDDGKSSLIGRLLFDSKAILEDQMLAIEHASRQRGSDQIELALLTDGLRAEREQNITIDVAYRYFSTPKRKFIVADTPGHLQYTRNMVTGTSTADLSVVLIDARNGVLTQSKRHAAISALLGIPELIVTVNKMDLVGFDQGVFDAIEQEFRAFTDKLGVRHLTFIPISALHGDNVVDPSNRMPWYGGRPLLSLLEEIEVPSRTSTGLRFPVQCVVRTHQDYRGLAGRIESGSVRVGDQVRVASSGIDTQIRSIVVAGNAAHEALAGQPAILELEDDVDVSRGDLLTLSDDLPSKSARVEAIVCWLQEAPLEVGKRYVAIHGTKRILAVVESIVERVDVDSLDPIPAGELAMNDIGRVVIHAADELHFDTYRENPVTGSFVLVDPGSNVTAAAGLIQGPGLEHASEKQIVGTVVWFEGSTQRAHALVEELKRFGRPVVLLHRALCSDAVDAVGALSKIAGALSAQGFDVLVAANLSALEQSRWNGPGQRVGADAYPGVSEMLSLFEKG